MAPFHSGSFDSQDPSGTNLGSADLFHIPLQHDDERDGVLKIGRDNPNKLKNAQDYVDWIYDNTETGNTQSPVDPVPYVKTAEHYEQQNAALDEALHEAITAQKSPEVDKVNLLRTVEYADAAAKQLVAVRRFEVERMSQVFIDALRSQGNK